MIAEIQCLPSPSGTPADPYANVDAAIAVIAASGLRWEVGPLGTSVEGSPDELWTVLRAAHEATMAAGATGVVTVLKLAEGSEAGVDSGPGIDDLVGKYRS